MKMWWLNSACISDGYSLNAGNQTLGGKLLRRMLNKPVEGNGPLTLLVSYYGTTFEQNALGVQVRS